MARVIKGSAIFDDDGGYLFTPYEKGKPENVNWLTLKKVDNGKLDCSKNKVRIVLTSDRGDPGTVRHDIQPRVRQTAQRPAE